MEIQRSLKKSVVQYAKMYPVIAITGPRQSGKTTFIRTCFPTYRYISLEDPTIREFAEKDPKHFLEEYHTFVILDEIQKAPLLFSYLQTKVDEDKIMGQFILSGSQNFLLMKNISQSLAGRVALFKMLPFDFEEMKSGDLLHEKYEVNIHRGFYPALYQRNIPSNVFYSNYLQTYVERDISDLLQIKDIKLFRSFVTQCATRSGQLLNLSSLAASCGISQPTAKSWLSVLESSYILFLLQPYHNNLTKRMTKTPKLYFYDTGLLCHLLKIKTPAAILNSSFKGALFENMIIAQYIKHAEHHYLFHDFWFWRDTEGHEVDLLWQEDETLNLVEIKAGKTIGSEMFQGLSYMERHVKEVIHSKTVVYGGDLKSKRHLGTVLPWKNCT